MITNRKTGLLAFLAIVLILALSACSQPEGSGASTAQVRVTGTAAQSSAKQRAASDAVVFASGTVTLQGEDITSQLKPSQTGTAGGSNDVEFEADIPVASDVVLYSVSPRTGFVFDEWKITRANRSELKIDYPDSWWDVLVEIQNIIKSFLFFIVIFFQQRFHLIGNFFRKGCFHATNLIWQFLIISHCKPVFSGIACSTF